MSLRIAYTTSQPDIYRAMGGVGKAVRATGLDASIIELVHIRVSQINGCAYCLSRHIPDTLKAGVTQEQINLVSTWRECGDLCSLRWTRPFSCGWMNVRSGLDGVPELPDKLPTNSTKHFATHHAVKAEALPAGCVASA